MAREAGGGEDIPDGTARLGSKRPKQPRGRGHIFVEEAEYDLALNAQPLSRPPGRSQVSEASDIGHQGLEQLRRARTVRTPVRTPAVYRPRFAGVSESWRAHPDL